MEAQAEIPVPTMNVTQPVKQEEKEDLITDQQLLSIYADIVGTIKDNNKELDGYIGSFANMVINEGDATSASKEALVNLVKAKNDNMDKLAKVADLMTRVKMKEKDTFPRYLAATQNNTIKIDKREVNRDKKELLRHIDKQRKLQNKQGN